MENLLSLGKALNKAEQKQISGGGEWYQGGCSNGGGTQWEGPVSDGYQCSCDAVWEAQMTGNEFGWAYMLGYGECTH